MYSMAHTRYEAKRIYSVVTHVNMAIMTKKHNRKHKHNSIDNIIRKLKWMHCDNV